MNMGRWLLVVVVLVLVVVAGLVVWALSADVAPVTTRVETVVSEAELARP